VHNISAVKTTKEEWALGYEPFIDWTENEEDISENIRHDKAIPQGPDCNFRGKHIPCFCYNFRNGSIKGNLLIPMLQVIDYLNIFHPFENGLNPFLLLDGHRSCFDLNFLNYVNAAETKWGCSIGLP
jgi:hypothetical protein